VTVTVTIDQAITALQEARDKVGGDAPLLTTNGVRVGKMEPDPNGRPCVLLSAVPEPEPREIPELTAGDWKWAGEDGGKYGDPALSHHGVEGLRKKVTEDDRRLRRRVRGGRVPDGCVLVSREALEEMLEVCGREMGTVLDLNQRLSRRSRAAREKHRRVVERDAIITGLLARELGFSDDSIFDYLKEHHPELVTKGKGKNAELVSASSVMRGYRRRHR
jgi:hypothetical protein